MLPYCTKTLVIAALLLTFIAQTIAAPISCSVKDSNTKAAAHQLMMQHEMQSDMGMGHRQKAQKPDCCDHDCSCPISICSSFLMVSQINTYLSPTSTFEIISLHSSALLQADITSLFRPPIFA